MSTCHIWFLFEVNSYFRALVTNEFGYPITWVQDASDTQVRELVADSDVFLSLGVQGQRVL